MKILLLDDEPFVLKLLARLLSNLGFANVRTCERAEEALGLLETDTVPFDLVFCDLQMPDIDGVEFVRHLARISYAGRLALVSGEGERVLHTVETLARAHGLDVRGTLHKPFSLEQLRQIVDQRPSRAAAIPAGALRMYDQESLAHAIANGELTNLYQPQVAPATGAVNGVEALVRWRHPRDGLVLPDQFVPVAEQHGLIDELTREVLSSALRQARLWRDGGLNLHVSVNVSMDNLYAMTFPEFVARSVREAGIPPSHLILELTETRLMKNRLEQMDILTRLRLKRTTLSIDDFGTGHSSLAQLRDIPFDELKVDRSFVHGAHQNSALQTIFEATLGMARQLGLKVVAEGVEDRPDWEFVRAAGCDFAQGYFIAKPMPASELLDWIPRWETRWQDMTAHCQSRGKMS